MIQFMRKTEPKNHTYEAERRSTHTKAHNKHTPCPITGQESTQLGHRAPKPRHNWSNNSKQTLTQEGTRRRTARLEVGE
jgi:hypothetical protein